MNIIFRVISIIIINGGYFKQCSDLTVQSQWYVLRLPRLFPVVLREGFTMLGTKLRASHMLYHLNNISNLKSDFYIFINLLFGEGHICQCLEAPPGLCA